MASLPSPSPRSRARSPRRCLWTHSAASAPGAHDRTHIVDAYDAFLRDSRAEALAPDCVLRSRRRAHVQGPQPIPRERATDATHILCDLPGSFRDPNAVTTHRLTADARSAADALTEAVSGERDGAWLAQWRERDARAREALAGYALSAPEPFEGCAVVELQRALPAGATLFAGNSMPVRDIDAFLTSDSKPLSVVSNRGANGIDGVVSSALGHAAAGVGPVALLIGDLSLFHDLNGLWAGVRHGLDLTVVVPNNGGSAIFHYLPQAAHGARFRGVVRHPQRRRLRRGGAGVRREPLPAGGLGGNSKALSPAPDRVSASSKSAPTAPATANSTRKPG